uniref:Reverse transcriptase domain-containing protein n=1 Tax=Tanacetum cinerariifolium TaxID=118510 RepID=A0A699J3B9_TANCI|nr:hypothetical protein [Tanacetum cinerariifolium]
MVNVIPPNHVDDVPVVVPNQHDDVLEPILVDEDEDPKEEAFEEDEEPQQEEDDMEVDIEEDENEPELTYPYEEMDPLKPPPVHEVGESSVAPFLREDSDRQLCGHETAHALVEKKRKAKDEYYGFMFEERPNEAIDVPIEDEKGPSFEPIMPPKSAPLTQAVIRRMIKESVNAAIAADRVRHANAGNDARGSGPVRGQDVAPAVCECTFAGFMKFNPTAFHSTKGAIELRRWFKKTNSIFGIIECVEGKKVKFAAATLQGPALTSWNAKIATTGLETVNQMLWTEMKHLMTVEFCLIS